MKLITQLYIDVSDNTINEVADYQLVEFFDFESIEITETIKNIQEIDVVFSDFTKDFVVPASKKNNKIFKHYYSTELINSFDARIKKRARIYLNGILFKQGFIRLSTSKIKDGYPYSYTLNFFGALSSVGDVIGSDTLSNLDYLERYNHDFNVDNVYDGLTSGLQYNGTTMEIYSDKSRDIVYPLISSVNKWYYDNSSTIAPVAFNQGLSVNIYNDNGLGSPDVNFGINYQQLKPAIKVANIFDAISEKYASINFKKNSFIYSSRMKDLYLLLHNRKGTLAQGVGDTSEVSQTFLVRTSNGTSSFNLNTGDAELMPIITYTRFEGSVQARNMTDITLDITIDNPLVGDILYYIDLYDGNTLLSTKESTSFSDSLSYNIQTENYRQWNDLRWVIRSTGSVAEYSVTMTLVESYSIRSFSASISNSAWSTNTKTSVYNSNEVSYNFPQRVEIYKQMPDMKIMDFLTGLFKMFNLVADVDDETGEINVLPLRDYYSRGTERDITKFIDINNYDVDRLQLYGNIHFKFQEPTTFGILNHNEVTQDTFGDLMYDSTAEGGNNNFIFDKGTYKIELPFEKLYFSRLTNENNGDITKISDSWLVDKDQEPALTKPILFFNNNTDVSATSLKFGLRDKNAFITTYNRGSNDNSDATLSLNFNSEINEFTYNVNENSLFELYYSSYIKNTFNQKSRNISVEAILPLSFLTQYSLSDRLLIRGNPFIINDVTTNLNTGKSTLNLVTAFDINIGDSIDVTPPADVAGLAQEGTTSTTISIIWNANTETDLAGYKVYVDDVLFREYGLQTEATITRLTASTSYDIKVTAYDESGNESALGTATILTSTTGAVSDNEAPTIPTGLTPSIIGVVAFTVQWTASTDNVAVASYTVYVDGVAQSPTSDTMYTVTGLTTNTDYVVRVLATDTSGNSSEQSAPITVRTN